MVVWVSTPCNASGWVRRCLWWWWCVALNAKQNRFVEEYLVDLNATKAAIRAGYSERTAEVIGYENLRKPQIQEAIQLSLIHI